ncbi:hypothetical protein PRIPAC_76550 [Pristionchus pacificus]|nr:hypothetical protein PRIPAC_76550 [Pristionchus pacificus]
MVDDSLTPYLPHLFFFFPPFTCFNALFLSLSVLFIVLSKLLSPNFTLFHVLLLFDEKTFCHLPYFPSCPLYASLRRLQYFSIITRITEYPLLKCVCLLIVFLLLATNTNFVHNCSTLLLGHSGEDDDSLFKREGDANKSCRSHCIKRRGVTACALSLTGGAQHSAYASAIAISPIPSLTL